MPEERNSYIYILSYVYNTFSQIALITWKQKKKWRYFVSIFKHMEYIQF